MKLAVFIERDAVLNEVRVVGQRQIPPKNLEEFQIKETAINELHQLKEAGFLLIATTNQPGLSSGAQARTDLDRMHDVLRRRFPLDDIFTCPHAESDDCPCRKPKPGLFQEASYKWHLSLENSFVISDKWQDAEAARTVGSTSLLLQSPWVGSVHHDFILPNLSAIVAKILELGQPAPELRI